MTEGDPTVAPTMVAVPVVDPCGITSVVGVIWSTLAMLGVIVTEAPPVGAGFDKVIVSVVLSPICRFVLPAATVTVPGAWTVTFEDPSTYPGAVAVIFVVPWATPLTLKLATVLPAGIGMNAGVVAIPGLLDVSTNCVS